MSAESSQPGSGLLVIDKPRGVTSHDVVAAVRSMLHIKRVGHAGTLDPMATGVLIVGFGHATRLLNVIVGHDKTYEATIRLGVATTTDDAEGEPIAVNPLPDCDSIDQAAIEQVIREHFIGVIDQVPSTYSAIKIDGKRAYDLARQGVDVELKARPITVSAFDVLAMRRVPSAAAQPGTATAPHGNLIDLDVRVTCSAGTYIRALGRDLGRELGVGGHLTALRRTRIGNCDVTAPNVIAARAVARRYTDHEGHEVTRNKAVFDCDADGLRSHAMPMLEAAKAAMPSIAITQAQARDLRFGRRIAAHIDAPTAAYVQASGEVIAILEPAGGTDAGIAKPVAVFPAD
ncbi:MAG: tRNA pseudouridine(55) synthase TruB [Bifidobacterium tibiigranuli]|uniref:tRNA pseudouridine(55) synthase TruB n=1 Tax=Bifidobacterium tibiigranuli TaxID=2172043 RepID=UPI0026ED010B|nr:tRNA pseudouridine(55) synthase TruB [Bifidobacterium tibiigranuli]MCI1674225.1 tRNA pseudouridine(55) synthase TruB [Bifidobacterium tibiigranuli]MCI1712414.1 tRNA pseudouridine(55) synthase TruB [Bifidobacterium tibiigranuli]MCI1834383.1 tRNA pseudouridine(55) synthase TruB [Bifidobacterium tibiigranuli]